jgi:glycosyltransferase involved in cell wall biosynthesis
MSGAGAAIRTGILLEALAGRYRIHLPIVPFYGLPNQPEEAIRRCCADVAVAPPTAGWELPDAAGIFRDVRFDVVHVSRLVAAPIANRYLQDDAPLRPMCTLDLDDFESFTRLRLARLAEATGNREAARSHSGTAAQFAELERHYLPLFDRIYVCSQTDRERVASRYHCGRRVTVVPNAVRIPPAPPAIPPAPVFTFLFVGTMAYYPNQDAVVFFCTEILPKLRERAHRPVRLVVAGARPPEELRTFCAGHPDVCVAGEVPDLAPYYGEAGAAIVPIRAGGGTRLKILEACGYRRPVISTRLGAEGLDVSHGVEMLLADTPEEFADACLFVMHNAEAAGAMACNGFKWVRANHTIENVRQALAG